MIRRSIGMLVAFMLVICISSFAFARGAPTKKAFASNAIVTEQAAPVANLVPVMTGYDVIQNITTERRDLSIAQNKLKVDTSAQMRLSTTVDWRSRFYARNHRGEPDPTCRSGTNAKR